MKYSKIRFVILIAAVSILGSTATSYSDQRKVVPSIGVKEEYNDNLFFTADNEKDDFITTVTPGFHFGNKTERVDIRFDAAIDALAYAENTRLNSIDHDYSGSFKYRLTPNFEASGEAGYVMDSRVDRDISTTGFTVGASERERNDYALGGQYTLSEKSNIGLNYAFHQDSYDDPEFADYRSHGVNLVFTSNLSTLLNLTTGRITAGYNQYKFTASKVENYSLTLGGQKQLHELWSIYADLGARYTSSSFRNFRPGTGFYDDENSDWGATGRIMVNYMGEVSEGSLTFYQEVRPASGRNGTTERTSFLLDYRYDFTAMWKGIFGAEYFLNKTDSGEFTNQNIDETTVTIRPRIRYKFTNDLFVEAAYNYTHIDNDVTNTTRERSLVLVKVVVQYPLFE